ncbi:glycoside hydrolase family 43 protein [Clostridium beijerinckii]|uniref:Xylan 1,4-beta-xylosidase n=1 Tax=Clostridium beijerinckii TaxID=1520 RepID=A0AAE5H9R8_CLOBE|nr:glycoside hydrolase family 43 protein [Clostridium beijerinckii]NSB16819.1 xylan 1,4-beta-xylosidase [Clostridium beijerinckii]OOM31426.1 beta-xylosidase [Clostridium beijerinckii]
MNIVNNPVIKGFNPDPSILRVNEDFYIATSTFEWFPGVSIYHSRDLEHWNVISNALSDEKALDLTGIDSACGIWAPNLTYSNGIFYLIYTIVYTNRSRFKDTHNFMVISTDIKGPWSKPVFLNCSGFDPSLFHDEDGRKWIVNMTVDHRIDKVRFSGIVLQEYDSEKEKLIGPIHKIFNGSEIGTTEGPNIIKYNGYYYLTVAEGGTEFGHCVTIARSKKLTGAYEIDPNNPMLTSKTDVDYPIQRAGHGQLVQDYNGNWYMAHLCSRPVDGYSILGRETAIQNIKYTDDGWFKIDGSNGNLPMSNFKTNLRRIEENLEIVREDFDREEITLDFLTLRKSFKSSNMSLTERKGYLRIRGGNSLSSKFNQSFIARRQQNFSYECKVCLEFNPESHHHMAGLVCYYNYDNYHYCKISRDELLGLSISITTLNNRDVIETQCISLPEDNSRFYIKACVNRDKLRFSYSIDGEKYFELDYILDMRILSDEHVNGNGFTGAMIGVSCQDLLGNGIYVDVDWFEYKGLD